VFLPTRIVHIYERRPYATWTLLCLNAVGFAAWILDGAGEFGGYALDPEHLNPLQFVTSIFLHAGLVHLLGNLLFLWVYGIYVEDRIGPWKMLAAYFAFGFAGGALYLAVGKGLPCVGASGAIAGLMGFTFVAAPWLEVRMFFFLDFRQFAYYEVKSRWEVPVYWTLGMWLLYQWVLAWGGDTNVAVSAHVGGFAAGAGLAAFLRSARCKGTSWYLEAAPPGGGKAMTRRLRAARAVSARAAHAPPAAVRRHEVVLTGLDRDASPVAVIKLLMKRCFLTPEAAKEHVDALIEAHARTLAFEDAESAAAFREEALTLGALGAPP
jgi:membrane associated rhomboid family serine protease